MAPRPLLANNSTPAPYVLLTRTCGSQEDRSAPADATGERGRHSGTQHTTDGDHTEEHAVSDITGVQDLEREQNEQREARRAADVEHTAPHGDRPQVAVAAQPPQPVDDIAGDATKRYTRRWCAQEPA